MKLLNNKPGVIAAVVTFVLIALFLYSRESRGSELEFEAGSAMVRGYTPAVGLAINFPRQGPANTDYEVGFLLSGQSAHRRDNPNAFTVYGLLVDGWKKAVSRVLFFSRSVFRRSRANGRRSSATW